LLSFIGFSSTPAIDRGFSFVPVIVAVEEGIKVGTIDGLGVCDALADVSGIVVAGWIDGTTVAVESRDDFGEDWQATIDKVRKPINIKRNPINLCLYRI
jgi:hypothetical protein